MFREAKNKPTPFKDDMLHVASTIHYILCGEIMKIQKAPSNSLYKLSEPLPNSLDTKFWLKVFEELINVRDSDTMPNTRLLRQYINDVIDEGKAKKKLKEEITNFNSIFD